MLSYFMVHRCSIEEQVQTKSVVGGTSHNWQTRKGATSVRCHAQQLSGQRLLAFGKTAYAEVVRFYFDADPGVTIKDRIRFNGVVYEVINPTNVVNVGRFWQVDGGKVPTR